MKNYFQKPKTLSKKLANFIALFSFILLSGQVTAQISSKYTYSYVGTVAYASIAGTTLQSAAAGVSTDAIFTSIPIGFTFGFNCQNYTTCGISNNGFIWFGTGSPAINNYTPLSSTTGQTGTIDGIISVAGSNITGSGAIAALRYVTAGTAPNRTFTVEWKSVLEGGVERCDHEIRLTETSNKIELIGFDNSYLVSGTANIQRGIMASTSDFKNLKTSGVNNLCSPLAGTLNTDVCQILATSACGYMTSASGQAINHTFSFTGSCCTPPATGATAFNFSNVVVNGTNSTADFSFTRGNGDGGVIAIARAGSAPGGPSNGTVYTGANTIYGSGTAIGGGFLVYAATGSGSGPVNVSLTGLTNGITYYISVYEYNAAATCYVGSPLSGNIPVPICSPPSIQASGNSVSNIQTTQADINWSGNGNGDDVIVFFKQGSAITTDPAQTTNYNANPGFGLGDQIGATGARAVYKGTGSSVTVTGLTTNITYYYAIYAHNSTTNCYTVPPVTGSFTTANSPMNTSAQVVTQASVAAVTPGSTNNQILQLRIDCTTGTAPALALSQLFFTTAATNGGTTNAADIANAKVFYTGTSSTFATTTQYGSTYLSPNGAFVISGSTTLVPGSNYFWLTYDIISSPAIGDFVDAKLSTIDLGAIITPSGDPAGNRQISLTYCTPSPAFGGTSCGAAGNIYNSSASLSGATFYSGGTCGANPYTNLSATVIANAVAGTPYTLTLNSAAASSAYYSVKYAWVDFNNNGLFTDPGENILAVNVPENASLSVTGASFTPSTPGNFRMRVAVMGGGFGSIPAISPCAGQSLYYGEFKDFTLSVSASSSPMVYSSSTTTQNTTPAPPNTSNQQVIGVQIVTTGALSPIALSSLTFNTNGSTNISADVTNARIFSTGISSTFSTGTQFGSTIANPNGSYTVTGSVTLSPGTNYFWVAYDVSSSATLGNNLDAECTSIIVDGNTYTPSVTAPSGARPISLVYCVPSAGATGCSLGGDSWITTVTFNGAGSTFNFTGGTCLSPFPGNYQINPYTGDLNVGGSYTLTMVKGGSSSGARFIAWADWNNDADFTDAGEMIMDVTNPPANPLASATGLGFVVPGTASAGAHRLRTWIGYTGTIVASDIPSVITGCEILNGFNNQGEIRDFTVNLISSCVPPVIGVCPSDIIQCDNHVATWTDPSSTGTTPTVVCVPASGSTFSTGATSVTCTATNSCGSSSCSFTVTVNETPVIGSCPSDITQCDAYTASWTNPTAAGSPAASVVCTPASGSAFSAGTTTVTCTATNSCGSSSCTFTVTVNETPVIGSCPSDITQCDVYTASWTNPTTTGTPAASVVCTPASGSAFVAGVTTVTCTATNSCGSSSCSFSVTVNETPVIGSCPANIVSCNPVVNYSTPASSGTPAASVSCTPASGSTFPTGTTTVTCVASNTCGSSSCSFSVTIQTSSVAATGVSSNAVNNEICLGNNILLTAAGGSLGDGADWFWYEGGCGTGGVLGTGSSLAITPSTAGVHTYYVRAQGTCNTTVCVSIAVSVKTAPPSGTIHITSAPVEGCVGGTATVSVNAIPTATFYRWNCASGGVLFNGQPGPYDSPTPTVTITYTALPAGAGSGWSVCVFPGNACGNANTICTWIRATISRPNPITGSVIGCPNTTTTYSCNNVNAASYQWSITGNATITGNGSRNITVNFGAGFTTGTLCVHAQTSCGYNSPDVCINISSVTAMPGSIAGNGNVCPNGTSTFSIAAVPGATSYVWTCSVAGSVVTNNGTSCSVLFPAAVPGGSTVCVSSVSPCGTQSGARCKGVASGLPSTPGPVSGPAGGQCGATGVSYSINPVSGATGYLWTVNNGATIFGPNNLSGVTVDFPSTFTTVNLTVQSINICGTSNIRSQTISGIPALPGAISGSNSVCIGGVELYSTSGSIGATNYSWTVPVNATILGGQGSSTIIVQWGGTSGNVSVRGTNACGNSGLQNYPVTVNCRAAAISGTIETKTELYPNPTAGVLNIRLHSAHNENISAQVADITGRVVYSNHLNANEGVNLFELDLSSLARGVYLLSLNGKETSEMLKVTVE